MKFKIRYADQIVGFFSLIALAGLVFFIFAIGASQNWFVKKVYYHTYFDSGSGFSTGMDITYKGFSIGKIKTVSLEGSMVKVEYYILGDYAGYVRENSLVELIVSPIGLGSSFVLHPGKSEELLAGDSEIFRIDSDDGKLLIEKNLIAIESSSDSIGALMNKVSLLLDRTNSLLGSINNAFDGRGNTPVKQIVDNINVLTKNLSEVASVFAEEGAVPHLLGGEISQNLNVLLENLGSVSFEINEFAASANKLAGSISPEVNAALIQLNSVLVEVQDVLIGVKNNPLIRGGVPDRSSGSSSTSKLRDTEF